MKKYEFAYKDNTREISNYFDIECYVEQEFNGILDKYDQERIVDYIKDLDVGEEYIVYAEDIGKVYLVVTRLE